MTSARPSRPREQAAVPHHLIDLADPGSTSPWPGSSQAAEVIAGIEGGTPGPPGRRHRALFPFGRRRLRPPAGRRAPAASWKRRRRRGGLARLMEELQALDPVAAARILPDNARRIVRAAGSHQGDRAAVLLLRARCCRFMAPAPRTDGRAVDPPPGGAPANRRPHRGHDRGGFVDEVAGLAQGPAPVATAGSDRVQGDPGPPRRNLVAALRPGGASPIATRQLARRQRVWFRRDRRITWIGCDGIPSATFLLFLATWNAPLPAGDL